MDVDRQNTPSKRVYCGYCGQSGNPFVDNVPQNVPLHCCCLLFFCVNLCQNTELWQLDSS
nr:MAG TPA: hypothetical protein [Caudoviricetes sp.]